MSATEQVSELNYRLRERMAACAAMLAAFELAAEYADSGTDRSLDTWGMLTQAKYAMAGVMLAHEELENELQRLA